MGNCTACTSIQQVDHADLNISRKHDPSNIEPIYDTTALKQPLVTESKETSERVIQAQTSDDDIPKLITNNTDIPPIQPTSHKPIDMHHDKCKSAPIPTTNTNIKPIQKIPTPPTLAATSAITCIEDKGINPEQRAIDIVANKSDVSKKLSSNMTANIDDNNRERGHSQPPLPSMNSMSKALMINNPSDASLISYSKSQSVPVGYTPITCTHTINVPIINDGVLSNLLYDPISCMKASPLPIATHWNIPFVTNKKDTSTPSHRRTDDKLSKDDNENLEKDDSIFMSNRPIPINFDNLLIYGYVRIIANEYRRNHYMRESSAILSIEKAKEIFEILFKYFIRENMLFCFDETTENLIYIADMNDLKTTFKCSIRDIYNIDKAKMYSVDDAGLTYSDNVKLPDSINKLLYKYDKHYNPNCNSVIFKCGAKGISFGLQKQFECSALIINEEELNRNDLLNKAYLWNLPYDGLPVIDFNGVIYSEIDKSLICIGGIDSLGNITRNCWKLSFNSDAYLIQNNNDWNWVKMPNMMIPRALPSCLMINHHEWIGEYLCVIGGYNNNNNNNNNDSNHNKDILLNSIEIFDFNQYHYCWTKRNHLIRNMYIARCAAGCCFQENMQRIFVGGGKTENLGSNKIEFCDLYKNEWYYLANTQMEHKHYPSMWIKNNYLLNIVSVSSNGMETIDLRDNKNKWNIIYSRSSSSSHKPLSQLFQLKPCPYTFLDIFQADQYKYRLIK